MKFDNSVFDGKHSVYKYIFAGHDESVFWREDKTEARTFLY